MLSKRNGEPKGRLHIGHLRRLMFGAALLVSLTLCLGLASVAMASASDKPQMVDESLETSSFYLGFEAEGIPVPIVDGWYSYKGDGRFTTESGLEFFWREGQFVNPDGSPLQVPEAVNEVLGEQGLPPIDHQPTRSVMEQQPGFLSAASLDPGDYLQYGRVLGTSTNVTGVQADVSIFDRSVGYGEYYLVEVIDAPGHVLALQMVNYGTNNNWLPSIHIKPVPSDPSQDIYRNAYDRQFSTSGGAVWKNMKLAKQSDGTWRGYIDSTPVFYQLPFSFSISNLKQFTQVELCTDSNTTTPHNPANHHTNIKRRGSDYSTWSLQYGSVETGKWILTVSTGQTVANNLYDTWDWSQHPYWDWMLEDNY